MTFGFPNPNKNSFRGNYMRKYGIYTFFVRSSLTTKYEVISMISVFNFLGIPLWHFSWQLWTWQFKRRPQVFSQMGVVPHRPFWLVCPQGHVLKIQMTLIINLLMFEPKLIQKFFLFYFTQEGARHCRKPLGRRSMTKGPIYRFFELVTTAPFDCANSLG